MKTLLALCAVALAITMTHAWCTGNMDDFRCVPYKHSAVCMSDGTYICGNCFAEEFECLHVNTTGVTAILSQAEAKRRCTSPVKHCDEAEVEQKQQKFIKKTANGQWY
ncbi:uncharacterized protein LOC121369624 [Gigantopelta aegis]|uniref:uncharacterized protein LOC121369624 n=1 Tax=Gigantopelta aegis TaxID=1735272 RepID=UPI001B88A490|nr:uncharacterized protein LOC121369624 [Gigantopelta aegis]